MCSTHGVASGDGGRPPLLRMNAADHGTVHGASHTCQHRLMQQERNRASVRVIHTAGGDPAVRDSGCCLNRFESS